jgi:hypothetical protein
MAVFWLPVKIFVFLQEFKSKVSWRWRRVEWRKSEYFSYEPLWKTLWQHKHKKGVCLDIWRKRYSYGNCIYEMYIKAIRGHVLDGENISLTPCGWGVTVEYETHFANIIFTSDMDWVDGTVKVSGNTSAVHLLLDITKMLRKSMKCVFHLGYASLDLILSNMHAWEHAPNVYPITLFIRPHSTCYIS